MIYSLNKIGSDAELFITQEGKPYPVCGLLGGTKEKPLEVLGGGGFAIQEDNVLGEFNIPPAGTAQEFSQNILRMLDFMSKAMKEKGLGVQAASSVAFPVELLTSAQAVKFGCEPDFCAWTRSVNNPPDPMGLAAAMEVSKDKKQYNITHRLRSAGYHIHVSFSVDGAAPEIAHVENFVKAQDLFLGVPSVLLDESFTDDDSFNRGLIRHRRGFYGRAGCFRIKPYGHEYRVLGGALLKNHPEIHEWIFTQTQAAINFLNQTDEQELVRIWERWGPEIQKNINGMTKDRALKTMAAFNIAQPPLPKADKEVLEAALEAKRKRDEERAKLRASKSGYSTAYKW